jgi:FlaA1/EpsC-like NDP-sugar epimerase
LILSSLFTRLTRLSVLQKQAIFGVIDIGLALATLWVAFSLRFSRIFVFFDWRQVAIFALAAVLVPVIFVRCGLYRAVFRYSSFGAAGAVARAVTIYGIVFGVCVLLLSVPNVPRTVAVIQPVLFAWAVLAVRSFGFLLLPRYAGVGSDRNVEQVLIYGAGVSGIQTLSALRFNRATHVSGFIDEDRHKIGREVFGVRVFSRQQAEQHLAAGTINGVLLAMPNVSRARRNEMIAWLRPFNVHVRTVPSVVELASGNIELALRELDVEDLLGREPVKTSVDRLLDDVCGQIVLVTGAGGSIGGELCRQLLALQPRQLLLLDSSEYALYAIHRELEALGERGETKTRLVPLLGNVRDEKRILEIFTAWSPRVVYHAAAYKHVPLVEHNPFEGVTNNVFGTFTVAQAAMAVGVKRFVLISTDKAVRPTNIMGASKRMAEIVLQALAAERDRSADPSSGTIFTMVRFGNVLGSSGSVVPVFRAQIAAGLPITVTHPEITRYFMSIPEAAQLVLQAGAMAQGGEVFLLDMGEPVRIVDLARRMVELSGARVRDEANPDGDIEIVFTGLRPGEKLYEELLIGENDFPTEHERIIQAREEMWDWPQIEAALDTLRQAIATNDLVMLRGLLARHVAGFAGGATTPDHPRLAKVDA